MHTFASISMCNIIMNTITTTSTTISSLLIYHDNIVTDTLYKQTYIYAHTYVHV